MKVVTTHRGFHVLEHPKYPPPDTPTEQVFFRLAQESSIIGDYPDACDRPGSSALWIGLSHHLNREEVRDLVAHLNHWLTTGTLDLSKTNH